MDTPTAQWNREDRDLLIELRTELRNVSSALKEMKEDITARVAVIEATKLSKTEATEAQIVSDKIHEDHERRVRALEKSLWIYIGGAAIISILGEVLVQQFLQKAFHG